METLNCGERIAAQKDQTTGRWRKKLTTPVCIHLPLTLTLNTQPTDMIHLLFSTSHWLKMCFGLNLPPLSWRASEMSVPVPNPTTSETKWFHPMCCCSSSFHSATFCVPLSFFCFAVNLSWKGLALSTANLSSRQVTFTPPASWGKVNHIPPVFMFGVSGVTLPVVWGFCGTSIILHSALLNSLLGSCWMPRLLLWH